MMSIDYRTAKVFLNFCAAHLPVNRDIETKFLYFLFWTCMSKMRNRKFHFPFCRTLGCFIIKAALCKSQKRLHNVTLLISIINYDTTNLAILYGSGHTQLGQKCYMIRQN